MKYTIEIIRLIAVLLITFTHTKHSLHRPDAGFVYFVIEDIPKIGTSLLSIISGYLFIKISYDKKNIISNKIRTLLVPYLIANLSVLFIVSLLFFFFDYNIMNRLDFDASLILEGVLSLNSPPINPPTYFIRDIFVIFMLIELFKNRNFYMLLALIPLLFFGQLILRLDILYLFIGGAIIARYEYLFADYKKYWIVFLSVISIVLFITTSIDFYKYALSLLIFVSVFNLNTQFYTVGAFTYLLHLYHSPIIVASYPFIRKVITHEVYSIICQVCISLLVVLALFFITRKFEKLRIICGYK